MRCILLFLSVVVCSDSFDKSESEIEKNIVALENVSNYVATYYNEINFDGMLGIIIAIGQLQDCEDIADGATLKNIRMLRTSFEMLQEKIQGILTDDSSSKMILYEYFLTNPLDWRTYSNFKENTLLQLGSYSNWTSTDILKNKKAVYKGVSTDYCVEELLGQNCLKNEYVASDLCLDMMFGTRQDTGHLLTHRLFFLEIMKMKGCAIPDEVSLFEISYCSSILKEMETSARLRYPYHDIFLEQVVFCGMLGYEEIFQKNWRNVILEWQEPSGCYKSIPVEFTKRTSNVIQDGCSDHSTGLGAAALAVNLKYLLYKSKN